MASEDAGAYGMLCSLFRDSEFPCMWCKRGKAFWGIGYGDYLAPACERCFDAEPETPLSQPMRIRGRLPRAMLVCSWATIRTNPLPWITGDALLAAIEELDTVYKPLVEA